MMAKTPKMLTVKAAAEGLNLPQSTTYTIIRNGLLGHHRYGTGKGRGTISLAIRGPEGSPPEAKWGDGT